jgi:hypothetical protein
MNNNITVENLAAWISDVINYAKDDVDFSISWFGPTADKPYSIVAGWNKMFSQEQVDRLNLMNSLCISKSRPEYVMCIKVAVNEKGCTDFASLPIPMCGVDELDDTCIPIEWEDMPECMAEFFLMEWERIMKEHGEEI